MTENSQEILKKTWYDYHETKYKKQIEFVKSQLHTTKEFYKLMNIINRAARTYDIPVVTEVIIEATYLIAGLIRTGQIQINTPEYERKY